MKERVLFISVILLIVIAAGYINLQSAKEEVVCNYPYIRVGTGCCLDIDNNSICDKDEAPLPVYTDTPNESEKTETLPENDSGVEQVEPKTEPEIEQVPEPEPAYEPASIAIENQSGPWCKESRIDYASDPFISQLGPIIIYTPVLETLFDAAYEKSYSTVHSDEPIITYLGTYIPKNHAVSNLKVQLRAGYPNKYVYSDVHEFGDISSSEEVQYEYMSWNTTTFDSGEFKLESKVEYEIDGKSQTRCMSRDIQVLEKSAKGHNFTIKEITPLTYFLAGVTNTKYKFNVTLVGTEKNLYTITHGESYVFFMDNPTTMRVLESTIDCNATWNATNNTRCVIENEFEPMQNFCARTAHPLKLITTLKLGTTYHYLIEEIDTEKFIKDEIVSLGCD